MSTRPCSPARVCRWKKKPASEVIGGSVNLSGVLYVEVTRTGADSTLSRIIRFVEDAPGEKAPISKTADKVAGVFVPTVITIALVCAIAWALAGQPSPSYCGCLPPSCHRLPLRTGAATPPPSWWGTGLGAQARYFIRSGEILEITHSVDTVVLDKTGTVTQVNRP